MDSNRSVAHGFEQGLWIRKTRLFPPTCIDLNLSIRLGLTWNLECWLPLLCLSCLVNCSPIRTRTKFIDIHGEPAMHNRCSWLIIIDFQLIFGYLGFAKSWDNRSRVEIRNRHGLCQGQLLLESMPSFWCALCYSSERLNDSWQWISWLSCRWRT